MSRHNHLLPAVVMAAFFLLAACGPAPTLAPGGTAIEPRATATLEASIPLVGTEWLLTALHGESLLEGSRITLNLGEEGFEGYAGCNNYGAAYSRDGSSLSFETISSTEMACLQPAGIMEQEAHYLELLAAVRSYHIYGDHLWLETGDGQTLVFFARER